jgi:hypothetical protein
MADDIAALGGHAAALWGSPPDLWQLSGRVANAGLDIQDEGNCAYTTTTTTILYHIRTVPYYTMLYYTIPYHTTYFRSIHAYMLVVCPVYRV